MIDELKFENVDFEKKIKQIQSLYESVRQDKNVFSQALNQTTDQNVVFKKKLSIACQ